MKLHLFLFIFGLCPYKKRWNVYTVDQLGSYYHNFPWPCPHRGRLPYYIMQLRLQENEKC